MWRRPEVAAPEAESERRRRLRLERERRVVQPQLLHRVAEVLVGVGLGREDRGEDHRLDVLEAGQGRLAGALRLGHRVADLRGVEVLDPGDDVSDLADRELETTSGFGLKIPTSCTRPRGRSRRGGPSSPP